MEDPWHLSPTSTWQIKEETKVPHKSELKMNSASRERISESNYQTRNAFKKGNPSWKESLQLR